MLCNLLFFAPLLGVTMLPWKCGSYIYSDELRVLSWWIDHVLVYQSDCLVRITCGILLGVELRMKRRPLPVFGKVRPLWSSPAWNRLWNVTSTSAILNPQSWFLFTKVVVEALRLNKAKHWQRKRFAAVISASSLLPEEHVSQSVKYNTEHIQWPDLSTLCAMTLWQQVFKGSVIIDMYAPELKSESRVIQTVRKWQSYCMKWSYLPTGSFFFWPAALSMLPPQSARCDQVSTQLAHHSFSKVIIFSEVQTSINNHRFHRHSL